MSREEQEARLLALAEAGETLAAVKLARALYAYDLTEARAFVEGLLGRKPRSGPPSGGARPGADGRGAGR